LISCPEHHLQSGIENVFAKRGFAHPSIIRTYVLPVNLLFTMAKASVYEVTGKRIDEPKVCETVANRLVESPLCGGGSAGGHGEGRAHVNARHGHGPRRQVPHPQYVSKSYSS
jgi:hypothetical protein